jgi:hypothetical protein
MVNIRRLLVLTLFLALGLGCSLVDNCAQNCLPRSSTCQMDGNNCYCFHAATDSPHNLQQ